MHHSFKGKAMVAVVRIALLLSTFTAQSLSAADFRTHDWGATLDAVKAAEGNPVQESADRLVYEAEITSLSAYLSFEFVNGMLSSAMYVFTEEHSNNNLFLNDFNAIEALLEQRYGKAANPQTIWLNDLYRDDPDDYGMAIAAGHMAKQTKWETERTSVRHTLRGDNFDITHGIVYEGKPMQALQDEAEKQKALNQL
jgi:hypothetical protein